jgi:hypothetical protein
VLLYERASRDSAQGDRCRLTLRQTGRPLSPICPQPDDRPVSGLPFSHSRTHPPSCRVQWQHSFLARSAMIFRHLLAWFRPLRPLAPPPVVPITGSSTVIEPATNRTTTLDLAEFGRLLASGHPDDLKRIAKAMTRLDRVA